MIRQIKIENFRCLRSVTLDLEPLTVFVGANASGKSSVFAALQGPPTEADRWGRDGSRVVEVLATVDALPPSSRLLPAVGGAGQTKGRFPQCLVLQLELSLLRSSNQLQETHVLSPNGFGLANLFSTLTRDQQGEVAREYCRLVPMFADVNVRPLTPGHHRIIFQDRWNPAIQYEPDQVSDGSMLMLAFLLLAYMSPAPDAIAIEEPERGLHPYLMSELVNALRRLANGQLGPKPVQVLLATHSAELLEFVEPKEVRFFHRQKDTGETRVEPAPVGDPSWLKTLKEYDNSLGDLWLSGGLGGVPGR